MLNICYLNISNKSSTTGVDRYLSILIKGITKYAPSAKITFLDFTYNNEILFPRYCEDNNYKRVVIPLPQRYSNILNKPYWMDKYFETVITILQPHLEVDMLYHVNSSNLIPLALKLKQNLQGKIISHVHLIPWKEYYEWNRAQFNKLYAQHIAGNRAEKFYVNAREKDFYKKADKIICVTKIGKEFVHKVAQIHQNRIINIMNGIEDLLPDNFIRRGDSNTITILFAGRVCEGKGIFFVLDSLKIVKNKGYDFKFVIAGACGDDTKRTILNKYPNLNIDILGNINFSTLEKLYLSSDIGVIPSLKEQASYVAIEMAMYGLPIVCTAVDGLDEIFTDRLNALKVDTLFSKLSGLTIDVEMMANKIITLMKNKKLRISMGKNIRILYEQELSSCRMIQSTLEIYKEINQMKTS
ncbi:MAG: glycosyltransferase family 4 protein [Bacteroidales bacterium]